jgi:hypothetical protein
LESADFFVLPLTDDHDLGVQGRPSETLLFANPGYAPPPFVNGRQRTEPDDEDDEDVEPKDYTVELTSDEYGSWSLHVNGTTALATLCLHLSRQQISQEEFAAAVGRFRERFEIWTMALNPQRPGDASVSEAFFPFSLESGVEALLRV